MVAIKMVKSNASLVSAAADIICRYQKENK